jgi:hypothetical protein
LDRPLRGSLACLNLTLYIMEHELPTFHNMPTLRKQSLERYLRGRFGSKTTLLTYGVIGKASSQGAYKQ